MFYAALIGAIIWLLPWVILFAVALGCVLSRKCRCWCSEQLFGLPTAEAPKVDWGTSPDDRELKAPTLDVTNHPQLKPEVKRAILASGASNAHAVDDQPTLRKPPEFGRPVHYDDVMAALRDLDGRER